ATRQYVGGVEVCHSAQHGGRWRNVDSDAHIRAMFELHRRYGSRDVMELLTEMETVNVDAGGPSSSSRGGPGAIIAAPIQIATSEGGDDDSDEDESSESSDGSEFVTESQARQFFASCTKPDT
ncbi:hypothetical protein PIB30_099049, partial [Stylosanthes scabra]|nr:hypothetical protein [Stylosanthes scabra]